MADREGECAAGAATTFGVEALDGAAPPTEAWVESGHHERLCEPVRAEDHAGTHWHFTITPGGDEVPRYLVVCSDEDHIARFALFPGAAPARGGILAPLYVAGGDHAGFLELKLHDDLGDLELWLTDLKGGPLDVPHSAFVALKCASLGRAVKLGIRNLDSNEDEDGVPNMRDGETNYFIFPAVPGTDASWLKGTEWRAAVEVRISAGDGASLEAKPFILVPHSVLSAAMGWRRCLGLVLAVLERRGEGLTVSSDGELAAALANCSNATLDGASFALAETAVLRGANCRVVVDGSAAAAAFGARPTLRAAAGGRVLDVRGAALVLKSVALAGCDAASDDGACVAASAGTVRLDDCAGAGGAVARVADGAALVAVGGSYAGGGYAFAAHGASATVDGGAYAGGGVLRLEGGAAAAVVGGTFANGTTAVDAADSNVTVRGGAFSGFAGPVLRARGGSAVVVLGGSYDGPSSDGFAVAGRGGAVDVAGGTFRFASREAGAALVNGSGAVAVSGAFLRVGDRWCAVLAAGAEGAFAVGGFAGPLARTYASAGAYAAAAACLAEATCYEITATGAAAGWTFAGRDYAGDGVVPFSLGADLCADGAPAASNATCPRSSRSGGDAGRDLDLLLAYSVVVLAIIGAVALSVTGCYVARRSADDVEKPRQVAPGDSSPLPGRQTVAAPLVATAPTDLAAVSARTALDLAAITLPAGDAVVVVAVAAGAPGARQTLSVNFVPPARHRAAAPAVAALRAARDNLADAAAPASEQADLRALLTHVLVPFLGAYAACAANEKTLVILQRARAAKTRALLRCYERGAAAVAAEGVGPVAAVCAGLPAAPPPAQPSGDAPALYAAAARARDALGAVAKAVAADAGGEATAPALKCIFRACEKAALGGRTLADVTDVLRARVACPTAAAVAAAVRAAAARATVLRCVDGFAALAAAPWSSVVCLELQLDGVVAELAVAHAALDAVDPCVDPPRDDVLSLRAASAILELHGKGDDRPREETKDDGPPATEARAAAPVAAPAPPDRAAAPPAAAPPEPEPARRGSGKNRLPPLDRAPAAE
ncbi:hypothetical protein AURANDRAFT_62784 [Aureococcus anophagefferens]|uniref:Uncharacterized protein n=1 Tax=Aureococcus anophagefferens TaxID=44056 RepID=F0Y320_AURAN|nr:hypothetical protein AURANDRAFT_62784 [Aureococcus anophagefferens]EGB10325.1 hypothetical protein AURANDRAFT_62784 [Aureococcus anophagefferens]|eukprot:XP_009035132.1 hypothetical protein AURANDRAFT_62784 [Aureococcus anophagefferens]